MANPLTASTSQASTRSTSSLLNQEVSYAQRIPTGIVGDRIRELKIIANQLHADAHTLTSERERESTTRG